MRVLMGARHAHETPLLVCWVKHLRGLQTHPLQIKSTPTSTRTGHTPPHCSTIHLSFILTLNPRASYLQYLDCHYILAPFPKISIVDTISVKFEYEPATSPTCKVLTIQGVPCYKNANALKYSRIPTFTPMRKSILRINLKSRRYNTIIP